MINQDNYENIEEAEIINDDFSPLDAPVKQRAYTQHKMGDAQEMGELEEPTFERPSFADLDGTAEEEANEPERPFNESYSQLDGKEKTMGAEMMAEMTLDIYEKGCFYLGKLPEISESKIDKLIAEGEIDASITLQTEAGNMPIKDFAVEFNDSIKEAFVVTDEFKDKVKAPLIRVFKKRGIGMTDEQLLAYYFGTDIATKGAQAFMLRKTTNSILDSLKENTMAMRENNMRNARPEPPRPEPPRPEPQPRYAERNEWDTTSKPRNINDTDSEPIEREEVLYTDDIVEVIKEPVSRQRRRPERSAPKTNLDEQLAYFESEEQGVYGNLKDNGGFTDDFKDVAGMPQFGDPAILSELERLSGNEPKKPVRKARTTAVKKPRGGKK
jgi:hypothetical protein